MWLYCMESDFLYIPDLPTLPAHNFGLENGINLEFDQ